MQIALPLSLSISLFLHSALLGWAVFSFYTTPAIKPPEIRPVEVAVITQGDLDRLRKGNRDSKELETRPDKPASRPKQTAKDKKAPKKTPPPKPQVKKEKVKKTPPKAKEEKPSDKLAALQSPKKDKKKEDLKKQQDEARKKAAAKKKADLKRKREQEKRRRAQEKKRKEKKRKETNLAAMVEDALKDKAPSKAAPSGAQDQPKTQKRLPKGPRAGTADGKDTQLTATQRSMIGVMFKAAVQQCWRVQTGMVGASNLVVEVEVKLDETGQVVGEPRVRNRRSGPAFRDAALNAVRAIKQCAPYADLPEKLYKGGWDHMIVTFDPQRMF